MGYSDPGMRVFFFVLNGFSGREKRTMAILAE
jgi:hypothetical protein